MVSVETLREAGSAPFISSTVLGKWETITESVNSWRKSLSIAYCLHVTQQMGPVLQASILLYSEKCPTIASQQATEPHV